MKRFLIYASLIAGTVLSAHVQAAQAPVDAATPAVIPPDEYVVGVPPVSNSTRETTQVVDGALYDAIAPIYNASDGNSSYLRFVNPDSGTSVATVFVVIVGTPTGRN